MKVAISNPWTFITLCLVLPVTAYAAMKWYDVFYKTPPVYAKIEQTCFQGFTDQYNNPAQPLSTGSFTVVNFFFTSCPVICPAMMKNMSSIHDHFAKRPDIRFVSISVDPEHDTDKRLQWFIRRIKINEKGWQFLRGNKRDTYTLARNQFNLVAADANDNSDFIHSDKFILIDALGNIRGYYSGLQKAEVDQLIIDIKKIK